MARDHYLPASLISLFADTETTPRSRRSVVAVRLPNGQVKLMSAESVCYQHGLFDSGIPDDPRALDRQWEAYEPHLASAVGELENRCAVLPRPVMLHAASVVSRVRDLPSLFPQPLNQLRTSVVRYLLLEEFLTQVRSLVWRILHRAPGQPRFLIPECGYIRPVAPVGEPALGLVPVLYLLPLSCDLLAVGQPPQREEVAGELTHVDAVPGLADMLLNQVLVADADSIIIGHPNDAERLRTAAATSELPLIQAVWNTA